MSEQSETGRGSSGGNWFGLDRFTLGDDQQVQVTVGPESHWDRSHLRRLRQSGDLPGMVPIIDADFASDGKPFAVTPVVDAPRFGDTSTDWQTGASITEGAARAIHEAHLRGLFHGGLSPSDILVIDDDVAVDGVGLGLGGTPPMDRLEWAAPEVREGAEPTERSDVYSLGKILEHALGDDFETVPRSVRRLIMWSSSDTPEARPPSAMEFARILAEGLGDEHRPYGPAFIPTSGVSDLAAGAGAAVAGRDRSDISSAALGAAGVAAAGAGAAVVASSLDDDDVDAALEDTGFSVAETVDTDPADLDEGVDVAAAAAVTGDLDDVNVTTEVPQPDFGTDVVEPAPIESVAAETGEITIDTSKEPDFAAPSAAQTMDLDETYVSRPRRNVAGWVIAGILGIGLAVILFGLLRSGDDETDDVAAQNGGETTEVEGEAAGGATDEVTPSDATIDDADDADDEETATDTTMADDAAETDGSTASNALSGGTDGDSGDTDTDSDSGDTDTGDGDADADGTDDEGSGSADDGSSSAGDDGDDGSGATGGGDDGAADDGDETTTTVASGAAGDTDTTERETVAIPSSSDETDDADAQGLSDDETTTTEEETTTTTEEETTTTEEETTTTTEAPSTTEAEDDEATEEDDDSSTTEAQGLAANPSDEPIDADDAAVQILHGVPGAEVDVYVNGEAVVTGFETGTIAGPVTLDPGDYEVELYAADERPAASSGDRTDDAIASGDVTVGDGAASVVAHLDPGQEVVITPFIEPLDELDPGQGRLTIRHVMGAEDADIAINGEIEDSLANGDELTVELDAGTALVEILGTDGLILASANVRIADGEAVALSAIGDPAAETAELLIQRYVGLSSAPVEVPTGDSGLLGGDDDTGRRIAYGLMAAMVLGGIVLTILRRRSLAS